MSRATRAFTGRQRPSNRQLPPGQYDAGTSWPVLTAEVTPRISTADWNFTVDGLVAQPTTWTWDDMHALPESTYDGAIHCVTTWSKFDMRWQGVSLDTLLDVATPLADATHVLASSSTGSTTNLPLADVTGGKAWIAFRPSAAGRRPRSSTSTTTPRR